LVEYDDVINKHRTAIYRRRREVIDLSEGIIKTEEGAPKTLAEVIIPMIKEEVRGVVNFHTSAEHAVDWNLKEIFETIKTIMSVSEEVKEKLASLVAAGGRQEVIRENIIAYLETEVENRYQLMSSKFLEAGIDFKEIEKGILIRTIDNFWVEHLETVDYLRRGIGLRGYGQHDPLVEYKKEAYLMYQELNNLINRDVAYSIFKAGEAFAAAAERAVENEAVKMFANQPTTKLEFTGAQKEMHKQAEARNTADLVHEKAKDESGAKVGRNDLCPCGSGKKYKHCHGK
jgi:preprotein translocase subunit SecA